MLFAPKRCCQLDCNNRLDLNNRPDCPPGEQGPPGQPGPPGVIRAIPPIQYDPSTQTVSINSNPTLGGLSLSRQPKLLFAFQAATDGLSAPTITDVQGDTKYYAQSGNTFTFPQGTYSVQIDTIVGFVSGSFIPTIRFDMTPMELLNNSKTFNVTPTSDWRDSRTLTFADKTSLTLSAGRGSALTFGGTVYIIKLY